MFWNNLELFNVEEIEESTNGIRLYRFPKNVMNKIGKGYFNRYVARMTTGCEIRFVGEAMITLGALEEDGFVEIFRGDFQITKQLLRKGEKCTIHCTYGHSIDKYPTHSNMKYSKDVWRIIFAHDFCGIIYNVDAYSDIRPPRKDETPPKKILAYGSSITHGACSNLYSLSYLARTGTLSNAQMLNKGMGGSCFCEKEMGDYIRSAGCDCIMLELGINMMDTFSPDEFYDRATYIVNSALSTRKKVALISPYMHFRDFSQNNDERELSAKFHWLCEKIAAENEELIFIDGLQILSDTSQLSADLIHPSMYGHNIMAERLSSKLNDTGFLN